MRVPFLDLGAATAELRGEIDAAIARVLSSGWYIGGEELHGFERDYAVYCEVEHCVGVGNGLDALQLALLAMGVGPGDEVIVASNTYIATWLAVSMVGATAVPVEPDPATHNLDPARIAAALSLRTRVILPTHLYGQPADLEPMLELARRERLFVLEDGAQAHGARYKGRRLGGHGDAVAWSFYPGKNLGALGDGGAVTTNDPALAERVRVLGNYGSRRKYVNDVRGFNSRLDPLQAAVLRVKLDYLDDWNARRTAIAARYQKAFADTDLTLPFVPDWADPAWHLYVVGSAQRDALQAALAKRQIETLIHYPIPPHLQLAYADLNHEPGSFRISERLAKSVLSLPMGPQMTETDVDRVIEAVLATA